MIVKESPTMHYLKDEIIKAKELKHLESREYKIFTLHDLACHHKFQRIISNLEKVIPEHKEFVDFLPGHMKKGEFPT